MLVLMLPYIIKIPEMLGPTIMAPEVANENMELNRFLFSAGTSFVMYVSEVGAKNAPATFVRNIMM